MRTLPSKDKLAIGERFPELGIDKKTILQYDDKKRAYFLEGDLLFIEDGDDLVPFLKNKQVDQSRFPEVVVDMPAVPFMAKGADLLRPGIVEHEDFDEGDIIRVTDERNRVTLAYMRAMMDSKKMEGLEKGKVAKSLHRFGDEWWEEY